jgi:hypothetical protein
MGKLGSTCTKLRSHTFKPNQFKTTKQSQKNKPTEVKSFLLAVAADPAIINSSRLSHAASCKPKQFQIMKWICEPEI